MPKGKGVFWEVILSSLQERFINFLSSESPLHFVEANAIMFDSIFIQQESNSKMANKAYFLILKKLFQNKSPP